MFGQTYKDAVISALPNIIPSFLITGNTLAPPVETPQPQKGSPKARKENSGSKHLNKQKNYSVPIPMGVNTNTREVSAPTPFGLVRTSPYERPLQLNEARSLHLPYHSDQELS